MVPESTKITWTRNVAQFEASPVALRARNGAGFKGLLDNAPHWDDSSSPFFGEGWDTKQNLIRRAVRAWQDAIIATRAPGAAPQSVARAAAEGFVEGGSAAAGRLGQKIANTAEAVGDGARKVAKNTDLLLYGLFAVVALALFLRVRG